MTLFLGNDIKYKTALTNKSILPDYVEPTSIIFENNVISWKLNYIHTMNDLQILDDSGNYIKYKDKDNNILYVKKSDAYIIKKYYRIDINSTNNNNTIYNCLFNLKNIEYMIKYNLIENNLNMVLILSNNTNNIFDVNDVEYHLNRSHYSYVKSSALMLESAISDTNNYDTNDFMFNFPIENKPYKVTPGVNGLILQKSNINLEFINYISYNVGAKLAILLQNNSDLILPGNIDLIDLNLTANINKVLRLNDKYYLTSIPNIYLLYNYTIILLNEDNKIKNYEYTATIKNNSDKQQSILFEAHPNSDYVNNSNIKPDLYLIPLNSNKLNIIELGINEEITISYKYSIS